MGKGTQHPVLTLYSVILYEPTLSLHRRIMHSLKLVVLLAVTRLQSCGTFGFVPGMAAIGEDIMIIRGGTFRCAINTKHQD